MDTSAYVGEALRQLSDTQYYRPTALDLTEEFSRKIYAYLQSLYTRDHISKTIYDRLITHKPCTPAFYHNPKIHKAHTHLGIPPGRPIISGNGCATEKISAFVDICLNPLVPLIPSYVKDSIHFIHLLEAFSSRHPPTEQMILATLDVSSLYTNIPQQEERILPTPQGAPLPTMSVRHRPADTVPAWTPHVPSPLRPQAGCMPLRSTSFARAQTYGTFYVTSTPA